MHFPLVTRADQVFFGILYFVFLQLAVNSYMYPLGLGAFHTGVEVYGRGVSAL